MTNTRFTYDVSDKPNLNPEKILEVDGVLGVAIEYKKTFEGILDAEPMPPITTRTMTVNFLSEIKPDDVLQVMKLLGVIR